MTDTVKITGFASLFNSYDSDADVVMPGAFTKSLSIYHPPMLWNHDLATPIGRWDVVEERSDVAGEAPHGLWVEGVVYDPEMVTKVRHQIVRGLSIGYTAEFIRHLKYGARELHEVELIEVSLVAVPMHKLCTLTFDRA